MNTKEGIVKKEDKLAELLGQAEAHPLMKQILAEKAAAILATRTEAAGKIEFLKKERDEVIPKRLADRDAKEEKFKRAKAALDTAGGEFQTARAALSGENQSFDSAIGRQEQILIESADPLIDETIIFFRGKLDYLRSPGRISRGNIGSETNIFTEKVTLKTESNVDAINAAMRYCQAAITELEKMKLCPELDRAKIEGMKAGVPKIDVFTESASEKPYGFTIANVNPRLLLPSDSQMEWEIGKLNEKFKKLMKK